MSGLSPEALALLQAEAHFRAAVPATAKRHLRISRKPLVIVPLGLAGEDGAVLALGMGRTREDLELLVCPEPRKWNLQTRLLRDFSSRLLRYLDRRAADREPAEVAPGWTKDIARRAPQIVVPTPAAVTLLQRVAERLVWQRVDVGRPADPDMLRAGGWLWFFGERHELVESDGLLLVATDAQLMHFVPPISTAEAAHLLALNAALAPPPGSSAVAAARAVEHLTGSTLTTPEHDSRVLQPAIEAFNEASRERASRAALRPLVAAIETAVRPAVEALYAACHDALDRLRALEPIPPVRSGGRRTIAERHAFTRHADFLARDPRFARADSLRRGLFLVEDAVTEQVRVLREARWYDPLARAVASMTGDALDGKVRAVRETTIQLQRRVQRLELEVETPGPWRPVAGGQYELVWTETGFVFAVTHVRPTPGGASTRITLRSTDRVRDALAVLPQGLRTGSDVAFVLFQREFPGLALPDDEPWMLAGPSS